MKFSDIVAALAVGAVVALVVKVFWLQEPEPPLPELPPRAEAPPVAVEAPPPVRHPLPQHPPQAAPPVTEAPVAVSPAQAADTEEQASPQQAPALPPLDKSDPELREALDGLAARQSLESLFNLDGLIRRFVVTVDNLPRKQLLKGKHRFNRSVPGRLLVGEDSNGIYLSEKNYARYDAFIDLLESLDNDRLVALYLHYYPLMQTAYEELGYPSAYFNDRLVGVIDHLLLTPEVGGRVWLVRPHVLYQYADPALESLSAGQKVLIRIGPRNAARVKARLRALRRALASQ